MGAVEAAIAVAVETVESLMGESIVRLDAGFTIDPERRACVVDASTEVGVAVVRVFTGLARKQFGERAFVVRRLPVHQTVGGAEEDAA
jgi:hypothetical protein